MKRIVLLWACTFWATLSFAQPANNDCSGATQISAANLDNGSGSCVQLNNQTITAATPWVIPPGVNFTGNCWNGITDLNVVFYSFDAQGVSGSVDVSNGPGNYFISVIEFNGAACNGTNITEWGCADNQPIVFDNVLTIGNTYYVIVAFENNPAGNFDLCVFNPVSASNDECVDAIALSNLDGTPCNSGLNNYYPSSETTLPSCFPANGTQSVWYSFTATGVSIADLHIEGAPDVANVAIWDFNGVATCDFGAGAVLACQTGVDVSNPIVVDNLLTAGNIYYIQVTFDNNAVGNFSLCLNAPTAAFNDNCLTPAFYPVAELLDASNCLTNILGENLNNDWPSSDVIAPACWDNNYTQNVWFQFVAQGPDVDIQVNPTFGSDEQIALIQFVGGNVCDPATAVVLACSNGGDLEYDNELVFGNFYYVMVGFDNDGIGDYCINIYNPIPPDNDTVCAAVPLLSDGSCNSGAPCTNYCYTTENANPEFDSGSFPIECQPVIENSVWFTVQLTDPNSVGFEINIEEGTGSNFSVVIGTFNDCSGTFFIEDFFCGQNFPVEFGPVFDENQIYYIMVSSPEDDAGTFNICVNELAPCYTNNFCDDPVGTSDAEPILGVVTNGGFVCTDGCNLWADPNTQSPECLQAVSPTVWYVLQADNNANILNINIQSDVIGAPTVIVYEGSCNGGLTVVPVNDDMQCAQGSGGVVVALANIVPGEYYFIAVSGINTEGGDFELCVNTLSSGSNCVIRAWQEVTARSFGGDLAGPFFPGEDVTICFTVGEYTPEGNQCQWFQGVVPVFGNGWDLNPFSLVGATMNGSSFPAAGIYGGEWNYFDDVHYNNNVPWYNIGDFDGNGTLDMCNSNYDTDCTGPGVSGGMNQGACVVGGDVLPPGWFAHFKMDACDQSGHPDWDWGDGDGCFGVMGPWEFCVTVKVKDFPDCAADETTSDLSVTFFTFSDGEIGSWLGGPSTCASDQPETVIYNMCCLADDEFVVHYPPFCTPGTFIQVLDDPNVDFWEWIVLPPPNIIGATSGSGPAGTTMINTLENTGFNDEIITYIFRGYAGGACPAIIMTVDVIVYPELKISMDPFNACATPLTPYELIPLVTGGDATTYIYDWFDGSSNPTLMISDPIPGQQYSITVTDGIGCSAVASVVLNVYETFPVDIAAPILEQCFSDGPIDLLASSSDGTPAYSYEWTSPVGNSSTGSNVAALEAGQWVVSVTDSQGCRGKDSITLNFFDSPDVTIIPDIFEICPNNPNPIQIVAAASNALPPYDFLWTTPGGTSTNSFIFADVTGSYSILVTDFNGCTTDISFDVGEAEYPLFDLGGTVTLCEEELALGYDIEVPPNPGYTYFEWSTGALTSSINVTDPGTYVVSVTNDGGCLGTSQVVIDTHDPIPDLFPFDTVTFCEGGFAEIEGPIEYNYDWSNGGNGNILIIVSTQTVLVTITDVNGCTSEDIIEVVESTSLMPAVVGDTVICNGVPIDISATSFPIMDWYDNPSLVTPIASDQNSISVAAEGWYYLVVSDGNGCFGLDSIKIVETSPDPKITGDLAICSGDIAILDIGTWAGIAWSTGQTSSSLSTDTAGIYTVTVTDQLGCSNSTSIEVLASQAPIPQISGSVSYCVGSSTTLDAGGPFDTYNWSTGEMTQVIIINSPGDVFLTVTNAVGCIGYDTISIIESTELSPQILGDTILCNGVSVDLDAGPGFASYVWSNGGMTQQATVSTAGVYVVTVTDNSGCSGTDEIAINTGSVSATISGVSEVCEGGMELISATPGFTSYEWSTSESTESINVSATGTYLVTVTDQFGCTGTASFDFTVNDRPVPGITGSITFCVGSSTVLDAGGSFAAYEWSTGELTQSITVSAPGNISVTVTDANGCTGTEVVDVSESTELTLNVKDTSLCSGETVTLIIGAFDTYLWSTTETTPTIDISAGGVIGVTVTDGQGCSGSASIVVSEFDAPFAVLIDTVMCNTTANGSILDFRQLVVSGDMTGTWRDLDNSGAGGSFPILDFDGVNAGQYNFEYTTNSAQSPCIEQVYNTTITVMPCACPSAEISTPQDLCSDSGILDLNSLMIAGQTQPGGNWSLESVPGGSNPATILGAVFNATNSDPGVYEIRYQLVGLPDGCPDFDIASINVNAPRDAGSPSTPVMVCAGEDTTLTLRSLISGGEDGGMWIETSVIPSLAGFDDALGLFNTAIELPGNYTFEYILIGVVPCADASTTIEVVIEDVPIADAGADKDISCDEPAVSIGSGSSSQGAKFTYLWTTSSGMLTDSFSLMTTVRDAGIYTLVVKNIETGCVSFDDVVIGVDGDIPTGIQYDLSLQLCDGDPPVALNIISVDGGTPPYSYSLNAGTPTTSPDFVDLDPGGYILTAIDALGCSYELVFNVPEPMFLVGGIAGDLIINRGDITLISYNLISGAADSVIWYDGSGNVLCENCDTLMIQPIENMSIELVIYDENLCSITLLADISVLTERGLYVPNVFTPNGDGINDFITVYGENGMIIKSLSIFSRWGDLIAEMNNIDGSAPESGWNGKYGNGDRELMPGVYVYQATVVYIDNSEEVIVGDITLIR